MKLALATYNILHGYHRKLILEDIKLLIEKGVDVLCLQEAEVSFEKPLNEVLRAIGLHMWEVRYAHSGAGGDLALAWNTSRIVLQNMEAVLLPIVTPVFLQRIKGHTTPYRREALIGRFLVDRKVIRITNVHLAWEGGIRHRLEQLIFLKKKLPETSADADIVGGDFNTFAPSFLRRLQQKKVEAVLGEKYVNVFPDLHWSFDIKYTAPEDKWETLAKICRLLGIKVRSRLDYIFTRNMKIVSAEMLDLLGSDHRPLIAKLELPASPY